MPRVADNIRLRSLERKRRALGTGRAKSENHSPMNARAAIREAPRATNACARSSRRPCCRRSSIPRLEGPAFRATDVGTLPADAGGFGRARPRRQRAPAVSESSRGFDGPASPACSCHGFRGRRACDNALGVRMNREEIAGRRWFGGSCVRRGYGGPEADERAAGRRSRAETGAA
jgi:hypothetical protein